MDGLALLNLALMSIRQAQDEISFKIDNGISLDKNDIEALNVMPVLLSKARNIHISFLRTLGLKYDEIGKIYNLTPARISQILSVNQRGL